jgi:hypothetical protein
MNLISRATTVNESLNRLQNLKMSNVSQQLSDDNLVKIFNEKISIEKNLELCAQKICIINLQEDSFQAITNYLTITESFKLLSNVSKSLRKLQKSIFLPFCENSRRLFLNRILNESIFRPSILNFGFNDGSKLLTTKVNSLINFFQQLPLVFGEMGNDLYVFKSITSSIEILRDYVGWKVSRKNVRSARLVELTKYGCDICVTMFVFICDKHPSTSGPTTYTTHTRGLRTCERSYSIKKCSTRKCDQPYIMCEGCKVNCYDCDMRGLCSDCLFETPNSGEVVLVCAPCRGFCSTGSTLFYPP